MHLALSKMFVRVLSCFALCLCFSGCGGGEQKTGEAPPLSAEAKKANDAYVNQYAKEAMKDKSKEKPATGKPAAGVAPGPGSGN